MFYSSTKTDVAKVQDFLVMELDATYNRISIVLANAGAELTVHPGEIVESTGAAAGQLTDAGNLGHWILAETVTLPAAGSATVVVWANGPGIVNEDALTVQAAATLATVLTDLKSNMARTKFITEPAVSQTGPLE